MKKIKLTKKEKSSARSLYIPATSQNRRSALRSAYAYGLEVLLWEDEAMEYADHYAKEIESQENVARWPEHSVAVAYWRIYHRKKKEK